MKIIYNELGKLIILTPASDMPIVVLAEKDVPAGVPFKIIKDSELPKDRTYRNAWSCKITEENKDGMGLTAEEFYSRYPELTTWNVK